MSYSKAAAYLLLPDDFPENCFSIYSFQFNLIRIQGFVDTAEAKEFETILKKIGDFGGVSLSSTWNH